MSSQHEIISSIYLIKNICNRYYQFDSLVMDELLSLSFSLDHSCKRSDSSKIDI